MNDPERVQHRYNEDQSYCLRCFAGKQAIKDGFVSVLCSGKPIATTSRSSSALAEARDVFMAITKSTSFTEMQQMKAFEEYVRVIVQEEGRT